MVLYKHIVSQFNHGIGVASRTHKPLYNTTLNEKKSSRIITFFFKDTIDVLVTTKMQVVIATNGGNII